MPSRVNASEGPARGEERRGRAARLVGICTLVNRRGLGGLVSGSETVAVAVETRLDSGALGKMLFGMWDAESDEKFMFGTGTI